MKRPKRPSDPPSESQPDRENRCPRFAELDRRIAAEEAAKPPAKRKKKRRPKRVSPTDPLNRMVKRFVAELRQEYPDRFKRRAKPFKERVLSLIRLHLPPYPKPGGRPPKPSITKAAEMYKQQQREWKGRKPFKANWLPIARECVPGFRNIRTAARRRTVLGKLRNSVYARLGRNKVGSRKNKRLTAKILGK